MCGGQRPPLATRSRKPWPEGGPDPARPRTETDPLRPQGPCFSSSQLQTPEWRRNRATSSPDTESNVLKVRAHLQTRLDSERRRKSRGKRNRGRAAEETRPVRPSARPPAVIHHSIIHPPVRPSRRCPARYPGTPKLFPEHTVHPAPGSECCLCSQNCGINTGHMAVSQMSGAPKWIITQTIETVVSVIKKKSKGLCERVYLS